jgi:hypothetical protein
MKIPVGNTFKSFNVGFYFLERTHLAHELSQAEQLQRLRQQIGSSTPEKFRAQDEFLTAASTTGRRAFYKNMHENRLAIERSLAELDAPDAPLPKRSAMKRFVKGLTKGAKSAVMVGLLSFASEKEVKPKVFGPPLTKEQRKRESRSARRQHLPFVTLLGQDKIDVRLGEHRLRNAQHLLARAREDHDIAVWSKSALAEKMSKVLPEVIDLVKHREHLLNRLASLDYIGAGIGTETQRETLAAAINSNAQTIAKTMHFASADDVIENVPRLSQLISEEIALSENPPSRDEALAIARGNLERIEALLDAAQQEVQEFESAPQAIEQWQLLRSKHNLTKLNERREEAAQRLDAELKISPERYQDEAPRLRMDALAKSMADVVLHSGLASDIRATKRNVYLAQELVHKVDQRLEDAQKRARNVDECRKIILELKGISSDENPQAIEELKNKFTNLLDRLDGRQDLPASALSPASAFKLFYQAVIEALAPPGQEADPARALAALETMLSPGMTLGDLTLDLTGDPESPDAIVSDQQRQGCEDARRVAQALAPLRRGMEIIGRALTDKDDPLPIGKKDLTMEQQAAKTVLLAEGVIEQMHEMLTPSCKELLEAASAAARKLVADPDASLTDSERVAYASVRNRLLDTPDIQYAADRLSTLNDDWIPRGVERRTTTFGPVGRGNHTGPGKLLNLSPTTGKTPLTPNALKLASKVSSSYGPVTDVNAHDHEIDGFILKSVEALRDATIKLAQATTEAAPGDRALIMPLLMPLAAADVAREKLAGPDGTPLRPEHRTLGHSTADDDLQKMRERLRWIGQEAGFDPDDEEFKKMVDSLRNPLHWTLASPLQAESLLLWNSVLSDTANQLSENAIEPAKQSIGKANSELDHLERVIDTSGPGDLNSAEEIYAYLVRKIEQLPERGRIRFGGGGLLGLNIKPVTYAIRLANSLARTAQLIATGGLAACSFSPRVKADGQAGKTAVVDIAMTSLGFEVFIGTEKRGAKAGSLGVGASGGNQWVRGSGSIDKSGSGETIVQEGVKFMIPRGKGNSAREYSNEEMREQGMKMLDQIFGMQMSEDGIVRTLPTSEFNGGNDVYGVPNNLARIMANCPNVSIAVVDDMSEISARQDTTLSVGGRLGYSPKKAGGWASANIGVRSTRLNSRVLNTSERTGYCNLERHNVADGGQLSVNGGLAPSAGIGSIEKGDLSHGFSAGTTGASGQRQVTVMGKDAKLRISSLDGRTEPSKSRREVEFSTADSLIASINADRETWIQAGVELLFKTKRYKHLANEPLGEKRKFIGERLDRMFADLREAEKSSDGRRVLYNVFTESRRMTDIAAAEYDGLCDEIAQAEVRVEKLQARIDASKANRDKAVRKTAKDNLKQAQEELKRLGNFQRALLQHSATWQAWKITSSQRTTQGRQAGFDLFIRAGSSDNARGQKLLLSWPY